MFRLVTAILVVFSITYAHGFWVGTEPVDCQVTVWSDWTTSSVWAATSKTRIRHILRYPQNGGQECPELEEVLPIEKPERIALTATSMANNFLSPRTTGNRRDLVVIVDSSGSIASNDFEIAKESVAQLLGNICPHDDPFSQNVHKAALLKYSSSVTEIFDFNAHSNTASVQDAIRNMEYSGGKTCTGEAFHYALSTMFKLAKGMRDDQDVKHEVLILTDGQSNCAINAIEAAGLLQEANIGVFGLMIGTFTEGGQSELEAYVSEVGTHLFAVENFQDVQLLVDRVVAIVQNPQVPCLGFDLTT